jgi:hypothetical protein
MSAQEQHAFQELAAQGSDKLAVALSDYVKTNKGVGKGKWVGKGKLGGKAAAKGVGKGKLDGKGKAISPYEAASPTSWIDPRARKGDEGHGDDLVSTPQHGRAEAVLVSEVGGRSCYYVGSSEESLGVKLAKTKASALATREHEKVEDEKTTPEKMPKKMKRLRKLDSKGEAPPACEVKRRLDEDFQQVESDPKKKEQDKQDDATPEEPMRRKKKKEVVEKDPPKKDRKKNDQDKEEI